MTERVHPQFKRVIKKITTKHMIQSKKYIRQDVFPKGRIWNARLTHVDPADVSDLDWHYHYNRGKEMLDGLRESVSRQGILYPCVVEADGDLIGIQYGASRFIVAEELGLDSVPVIAIDYSGRYADCPEITTRDQFAGQWLDPNPIQQMLRVYEQRCWMMKPHLRVKINDRGDEW